MIISMTDYEVDKDAPELCDMANFTIICEDDTIDPDVAFAYGYEV